uniref:Polyprotein n=1 Tax=Qianjiang picorna-like virus 22 TaxID=3239337 RepID=A0AB39JCP9_9VIRU
MATPQRNRIRSLKSFAPMDPRLKTFTAFKNDNLLDPNAVFAQRQQKRQLQKQSEVALPSGYCKQTVDNTTNLATKQHNRDNYATRISLNAPGSPLLDLNKTVKGVYPTNSQRISEFNRHSLCSCNNAHATFTETTEKLPDGTFKTKIIRTQTRMQLLRRFNRFDEITTDKHHYLVPKCDHGREHIAQPIQGTCHNCSRQLLHHLKRKDCECEAIYCSFCRRNFYTYSSTTEEYCHCPKPTFPLSLRTSSRPSFWQPSSKAFLRSLVSVPEVPTISMEDFPELTHTAQSFDAIRETQPSYTLLKSRIENYNIRETLRDNIVLDPRDMEYLAGNTDVCSTQLQYVFSGSSTIPIYDASRDLIFPDQTNDYMRMKKKQYQQSNEWKAVYFWENTSSSVLRAAFPHSIISRCTANVVHLFDHYNYNPHSQRIRDHLAAFPRKRHLFQALEWSCALRYENAQLPYTFTMDSFPVAFQGRWNRLGWDFVSRTNLRSNFCKKMTTLGASIEESPHGGVDFFYDHIYLANLDTTVPDVWECYKSGSVPINEMPFRDLYSLPQNVHIPDFKQNFFNINSYDRPPKLAQDIFTHKPQGGTVSALSSSAYAMSKAALTALSNALKSLWTTVKQKVTPAFWLASFLEGLGLFIDGIIDTPTNALGAMLAFGQLLTSSGTGMIAPFLHLSLHCKNIFETQTNPLLPHLFRSFKRFFTSAMTPIQLYRSDTDEVELTLPLRTHTKQSGESLFSTFFDAVCSFAKVARPAFTYFANLARDFNNIFRFGSTVGDMLKSLLEFLPRFVQRWFISTKGDEWLAHHIADKTSPVFKLWRMSIGYHEEARLNADDLASKRSDCINQYNLVLNLITTENIGPHPHLQNFLQTCMRLFSTIGPAKPRDAEPFCLYVSGDSGVGKSNMLPLLLAAIDHAEGKNTPEDELKKYVYTKTSTSEYWAGYNPLVHKYVVYDDFAQDRAEQDIKDLISIVSVNAFIPEMPSVDPNTADTLGVKGTQFTSPYVILLSNLSNIESLTQQDNSAVNRRRHLHFHLTWKNDALFSLSAPRVHQPNMGHAKISLLKAPLPGFTKEMTVSLNDMPLIISESVKSFHNRVTTLRNTTSLLASDWKQHITTNMKSDVMQTLTHAPNVLEALWFTGYMAMDVCHKFGLIYRFAAGMEYFWNKSPAATWILLAFSTFMTAFGIYLLLSSSYAQSGTTTTSSQKPIKSLPQSGTNLADVLHANTAYAELFVDGVRRRYTTIYFLKGTTFITVEHFFLNPNDEGGRYIENATLRIIDPRSVDSHFDFPLDPKIISRVDKKDLALYTLPPNRYSAHRDMTNHFNDSTATFRNKDVEMGLIRDYKRTIHIGTVTNETATVIYETSPNGKPERVISTDCIEYSIRTDYGDCGSPVILLSSQPKIIALHTSSNIRTSHGTGVVISKALIQRALKEHNQFTICVTQSKEFPYTPATTASSAESIGLEGVLTYEGLSERPTHQPTKTKLRPSPIQGLLLEPTTAPAVLSETDSRIPKGTKLLVNGINKYSKQIKLFPEDIVAAAAASIEEELLSFPSTTPRRLLTLGEAINGIPDEPYIDSLNFSTSSGAPFSLDNKLKGKKDKLFNNVNNYRTIADTTLQNLVDERLELLQQSSRPLIPWLDSLKDERRPIAKQTKPRLFVVAPLDYVIIDRMYNLCFTSHFYQSRIRTFSAVGINKGSREWDLMIRTLSSVGNNGFDGDYSSFDGTLSAQLASYLPATMTAFYGDDNLAQRRTLLQEIFFCFHQGKNFLYSTKGGNSSGGDMTVVINTYVSEMYLRCAWQLIMPSQYSNLYYYRKFVRTAIYGDDNLVIVDDYFITYFNATTVSKKFAEYGLVYTSASKTSQDVPYKPITELSFLKNTTRLWNGYYVPLFDESANLEITNWIRQCEDPEQATEDNCNAMLRSAFFYGRQRYMELRNTILSARPTYNLLHFNTLFNEFFQQGYISDPTNDYGFTRNPGNVSREDTHHYLLL